MSQTEIWLEVSQIILIILGLLGISLIPQFFYQKKIDKINQSLNALNIAVEQNHGPKMEAYKNFMEAMYRNTKNPNKNTEEEMKKAYEELSRVIFLYGSDRSIEAFIRLRENNDESNPEMGNRAVALIAEFMLELRKDLNPNSTNVKAEYYLRLLINDWEGSKDRFLKYLNQ